jgi:hypothetical protein
VRLPAIDNGMQSDTQERNYRRDAGIDELIRASTRGVPVVEQADSEDNQYPSEKPGRRNHSASKGPKLLKFGASLPKPQ